MSKPGLNIICCTLLVLLFCGARWQRPFDEPPPVTSELQSGDLESVRSEVSGYRNWTLVNPHPVLMDPVVSVACAAANVSARNPHSNKYISVYVNDAGRNAMMSEKYPRFPQGSIIVKAKSGDEKMGHPELLTIMVKRAEGFDRANGNWEYLVMDGDGSNLERPAKVESCQACHLAHRETDFVSRMYLPMPVREKLR